MSATATTSPTSTTTPAAMPSDSAPFQDATPAQLRQWLRSGEAILIDVREPDEYAREQIAGATLLPLSRFEPAQALSKAKPAHSRSATSAPCATPPAASTG